MAPSIYQNLEQSHTSDTRQPVSQRKVGRVLVDNRAVAQPMTQRVSKFELGAPTPVKEKANTLNNNSSLHSQKAATAGQRNQGLTPIQRIDFHLGAEDAQTANGAYIWHPRWTDTEWVPIPGSGFNQVQYAAMPTGNRNQRRRRREYYQAHHREADVTVMRWGVKAASRAGTNQWVYFDDRTNDVRYYNSADNSAPISNAAMAARLPANLQAKWGEFIAAV